MSFPSSTWRRLPAWWPFCSSSMAGSSMARNGRRVPGCRWYSHRWPLGMIRARPRREFVHVSLVFLIWGVISVVVPSLSDPHFLTLALVVCSLGLQVTDLAIRPGEQVLCDRLAIQGVSLGAILRAWWFGLGLFGIVLGSSVVMAGMAGASAHSPELRLTTSTIDWWAITASIVLVGTQIVLAGLDSDLLAAMRPEGLIVGVELTGVALLWWLGVAGSPLGMWDLQPGHYYPLATALAGLVIAEWNSRLGQRENLAETAEQGRALPASMSLLSSPVLVLSLLAPVFTFGRESSTTVATLVFVAMALGLWAVRREQVWAAYLAGLAWSAAGLAGGLVVGRHWNWIATEPRLMSAALGELVAVFTLGGLGGWFRQRAASQEREKPDGPSARVPPRGIWHWLSNRLHSSARWSWPGWSPWPRAARLYSPAEWHLPVLARCWLCHFSISCLQVDGTRSGWCTWRRRVWSGLTSIIVWSIP